jgi:hypothetical protein
MNLIRTCDNNKRDFVIDKIHDIENIREIANIRIDELIKENPINLFFPVK